MANILLEVSEEPHKILERCNIKHWLKPYKFSSGSNGKCYYEVDLGALTGRKLYLNERLFSLSSLCEGI